MPLNNKLKNIIESLIFVSVEPLSMEKIKELLTEYPEEEIEKALQDLLKFYESNHRGIQIIQVAGGYLFSTKPGYDQWIRRLLKEESKSKLSPASLETLSVIAYHQPTTLSEISVIRNTDSTHSVKTLLRKKLIKIVGRKKAPGKPLIYRTTDKFLTYFELNSLNDLPSPEELTKLIEEENFNE